MEFEKKWISLFFQRVLAILKSTTFQHFASCWIKKLQLAISDFFLKYEDRMLSLPDFLNLVSQPCERLIQNITITTLNCIVLFHNTIQIYIIRFQPIKMRLFGFQN